MTIKTFSRARAAKAALQKILDSHEITTGVEVSTYPHPGGVDGAERFTAHVHFDGRVIDSVILGLAEADVVDAGFGFSTTPGAPPIPAILDMGEAGDATPYPAPLPPTEGEVIALKSTPDMGEAMTADEDEALQNLGVVPAGGASPKIHGYVSEVSSAEGPTKRVWTIADSMPGAKRKEVIEACRQAGVAFGTARTQYQKWFSAQKNG